MESHSPVPQFHRSAPRGCSVRPLALLDHGPYGLCIIRRGGRSCPDDACEAHHAAGPCSRPPRPESAAVWAVRPAALHLGVGTACMLGSRKVVILEDKHVLVETFNVLKLIYFVQNLIAIAGRAFRPSCAARLERLAWRPGVLLLAQWSVFFRDPRNAARGILHLRARRRPRGGGGAQSY